MDHEVNLTDLRHPLFTALSGEWNLWRTVYEGGEKFINQYLEQFSKREDAEEFRQRKKLAVATVFSAAAVDDVKNSIYQRMIDISRNGGSKTYQDAVLGGKGGVDYRGSSMHYFIGQKILPELLVMQRVGVYVDMPPLTGATMLDVTNKNIRPYLYCYQAEEICNWVEDYNFGPHCYRQLLLKETYNKIHPKFGVPYEQASRYRQMWIDPEDGFCRVQYFGLDNGCLNMLGQSEEIVYKLQIKRIPFYCFELPHSLLKNVARHDVALLNIESTDIGYILKANFPVYTEQQDWRSASPHTRQPGSGEQTVEGQAIGARQGGQQEVAVGTTSGRAYAPTMDRPGFIHPSSEPLEASMRKQEQLKKDIRLLINLALTNMTPTKQSSVESKQLDNAGLESGLSFIGLELEKGERMIAEYWALYENSRIATVDYPTRYNLKSDEERRAEGEHYRKMIPIIPSPTYQKQVAKQLARALVGYKVTREDMEKIEKEIDTAEFIAADPEIIQRDVELGILAKKYASDVRLYPKDNISAANEEHATRLKVIQSSQTPKNGQPTNPASRGNPDASGDPKNEARTEKEGSRNLDNQADPTSRVRGNGK